MRLRHWIELFSDYDCKIRYHLGKENVVDDALTQEEASDESAGLQRGIDELIECRSDGALYYLDRIWVPLKGDVRTLIMDEAYKSKYYIHLGADKMYYDLRDEGHFIRHELVQETTEKISQIKDKLKAACDRHKSYADKRRKPLEFSVGEYVLLKVSPWKGVVHFGKRGNLHLGSLDPLRSLRGSVQWPIDLDYLKD
ncbi:hypothetical protein Tco_1092448 [Tanacetum coccineum]|uniref:Reverse transcriptase domain-containing protein n=1 Tax=Tanacetum coccineum TaxID=301880 RepID=A0ABQ5IB83_9ASTR